ncbi:MAG: hypothetical protein HY924_00860 [Elusimicrobia bacterium]|nr:hypothetical protein [Elusimicrobiota bacterium]
MRPLALFGLLFWAASLGTGWSQEAAVEPPPGAQVVKRGNADFAIALDASYFQALAETERQAALDAAATWALRRRFAGGTGLSAENKYLADSLSAALGDFFKHRSAAQNVQVFFPGSEEPGVMVLNEFTPNGVLQTRTAFEPTGTGWGVGVGDLAKGLSVYVRHSRSATDAEPRPTRIFQYLGRWGMERFSTEVESNTERWYWWIVGPKTWETPVVTRLYRESGSWVDKGEAVKGREKMLYRAPGIIGQYYNTVNGAIGLPPPFYQSPDCQGTDLSGQFPDPAVRNQCSVGSCHSFSSIGTVEAALRRAYGAKVRLSEADLFINMKVKKPELFADSYVKSDTDGNPRHQLSEGGFPEDNLAYALENGVATDKTVPYADMMARYYKWRSEEQKLLDSVRKDFDKLDPLARLLSRSPEGHWADLRTEEHAARLNEAVLTGKGVDVSEVSRERDIVKRALQGFAVEDHFYTALDAGLSQRRDITRLLCAGIPVGVSMELRGLSEWGTAGSNEHARHAFVLTGFKTTDKGLVFKVRNSWGGFNPDVQESQLGRIYGIQAVLGPGEPKRLKIPPEELKRELQSLQ